MSTIFFSEETERSFLSMDGINDKTLFGTEFMFEEKLETFAMLVKKINSVFEKKIGWTDRENMIISLLKSVDAKAAEISKYTFFDSTKPYTRNLIATDGTNYSLMLLCWNSGAESKIHNHPCDGCFVKTLRGCIRETRYTFSENNNEIVQVCNRFYSEGQVSLMKDSIGLHKISNPNKDMGAVSLHLYTPPFANCKVWDHAGKDQFCKYDIGKMGYYSVFGIRTPHLEGKPSYHAKLIAEMHQKFSTHVTEFMITKVMSEDEQGLSEGIQVVG